MAKITPLVVIDSVLVVDLWQVHMGFSALVPVMRFENETSEYKRRPEKGTNVLPVFDQGSRLFPLFPGSFGPVSGA